MIVKFWGVRGSYTTSRAGVLRYGGNTSCVSVQIEDRLLVIDAGSGVIQLGVELGTHISDVFFILTHLHRDHIEGFPFFRPLYESGRRIHFIDYQRGNKFWTLLSLLDGLHYPMKPAAIRANYTRVRAGGLDYLRDHGFFLKRIRMNHPGGAWGFKVMDKDRTFVHMPDNELMPEKPRTSFDEIVDFCEDVDLLSHDAMYLESEMAQKRGWGHSAVRQACALARAANVGHLVLTHHEPDRDDDVVDALQDRSQKELASSGIACTAAYEGLEVRL